MATQRKFNFGNNLNADNLKNTVGTTRAEKLKADGFSGRENNTDSSFSDLIKASEFNYIFKLIEQDINTVISKGDENKNTIDTLRNKLQGVETSLDTHKGNFESKVNSLYGILENRNVGTYFDLNKIKITDAFLQNGKANNLEVEGFVVKGTSGNADFNLKKNNGPRASHFSSAESSNDGKVGLWVDGHDDIFTYNLSNRHLETHKNFKLESGAVIDAGSNKIIQLGDPQDDHNATNKRYVDNKFLNVANPSANNHAANKVYVDNKISEVNNTINNKVENVVKKNIKNTFSATQDFENNKGVEFLGTGNSPINYTIKNEDNKFKISSGNNNLIEWNSYNNYIGGKVGDEFRNIYNTGKFKTLQITNSSFESQDLNPLEVGVGQHKILSDFSDDGSSYTYRREFNFKLDVGNHLAHNWKISSGKTGEEENKIDIAFNANGLTDSRLKEYIDNAISRLSSNQTQKDYKIYKTYKSYTINESGTWVQNVFSFNRDGGGSLTVHDNIVGLTLTFHFKNNATKSFSFSSLPIIEDGLSFNIVANDQGGIPYIFYFKIKPYHTGTNANWHDFNITYSGAHKLYDAAWTTGNHINKVEIAINYQK